MGVGSMITRTHWGLHRSYSGTFYSVCNTMTKRRMSRCWSTTGGRTCRTLCEAHTYHHSATDNGSRRLGSRRYSAFGSRRES